MLIEAAAAGIAIVTSDVGVAGSILENEKSALICPVNDAVCFEEKMRLLLKSPMLGEAIGAKAKEMVQKHVLPSKKEYLRHYKVLWEATYNSRF